MWNIVVTWARAYLLPVLVEAFNKVRGVPKDVADIEEELERIQAFINGAEKEGNDGEEDDERRDRIKEKVKELREAAFRIEDIIDDYMICDESQPGDPGCAALPCEAVEFIKSLILRLQIANKIQNVKSLVHGIDERYSLQSRFSLEQRPNKHSCRRNRDVIWQNLRMDPLYIEETEVVGIEGQRDKLKEWLTKGRKECSVISVVGMGGLGKTTLAKQVFDNKEVHIHFRCHAWITVSQNYTVERLLRDMLNEFCKEKNKNPPRNVSTMDQKSLIDEVRNHLRQNRYVVVFDDVWNENFWHDIRFAIIENKQSSRILITTRYDKVAECCVKYSSVWVHKMERLSDEKSLELFYKKAFRTDFNEHCPEQLVDEEAFCSDSNGCCPDELVDISLEIVKKCDGLPLAIVVIGGLLFSKDKDVDEWKKFCQDLSLELESNPELKSITKILGLSYDDLPYNLKSCLLYFGMYPEDYEIKSNRLIKQWIAEGFVKGKTGKTSKEVAQQCLTELIHRSLVQVSSFTIDGKAKRCRVHDLLRTMILSKIKDTGFCEYIGEHDQWVSNGTSQFIGEQDQSVSSGIIRRLTIASSSNDLVASIESSYVRSILFITDKGLSEHSIDRILAKSMPLKVLDFEDARLSYVPQNLGNLIHLKYLSLRNTRVKSLPKSIGKLQNLETLDVRQTSVLEMPKEISKLRKLRHLLANMISFIHLKDGLGGMTSLQKISMLIIDYDGVVTRELGKLKQLRDLNITSFRREHGNTLCSSINEMQFLEKLHIDTDDNNEVINLHFKSSLSTLRKLCLRGKLENFPYWIPRLRNLVKLSFMWSTLTNDPLESLKDLQSLLFLSISHHAYEGETLHFQHGGFRKLKELELKYLYNLNTISIDEGALQSLKKLQLSVIPQLNTVPSDIQHLKNLEILNMWFMSNEFEQSIAPNGGQEHWIFQHVPRVILLAGLL
ncbi:Disease resistance protein RPM1, partial [Mucuna pruriens]